MSFLENLLYLISPMKGIWLLYESYAPLSLKIFVNDNLDVYGLSESDNIVSQKFSTITLYISCAVTEALSYLGLLSYVNLSSTTLWSMYISFKFLACIAFLIFSRGGIPRFRFDYLTKLGWIRFLSLVLLSFLIEIYLISLF